MGQTAEDVRDNIVKITDKNGEFAGTGFFIHKEYCVTCHHNISRLDEIYVERDQNDTETGQQRKRRHPAEWAKEFSNMQRDVAFLRVKNADFKPLQYGRETYGEMPVVVRGFPFEDLDHHPDGKDERGTLSEIDVRLLWHEEEVQGTKEWNIKPKVNVQVFNFSGKFDLGFSGAPVCYNKHGLKVIGMFEAKDANKGYVIPMNIVVGKYEEFNFNQRLNHAIEKATKETITKPSDMNRRSLIWRRAQRIREVLQGAHILWVDDHPENNIAERNILGSSFEMYVDIALSTDKAILMLQEKNKSGEHYDVVISDMERDGKHKEGEQLLKMMRKKHKMDVPVIFYVGKYDPKKGIPPYAFGMTSRPDHLLHYIMDALERQRS